MNPAEAEFCSQCGAALKEAGDGSDAEVYKEFARANLFRMRGDSKSAIDVCLGVLRRFPNNVTAHGLLGDIYGESGQLRESAQWYEMALDLDPEAQGMRAKLEAVNERAKREEASQAAEQIGLPPKPQTPWAYIALVAVLVLAVGTSAYLLGRQSPPGPAPTAMHQPIEIDAPPVQQPPVTRPAPPTEENEPVPADTPIRAGALAAAVQAEIQGAVTVIAATQDPRGPRISVNVADQEDIDPRVTALTAGLAAFAARPQVARVHVTVLGKEPVFAGTVYAEEARRIQSSIQAGQPLSSLLDGAFTDVWPTPSEGQAPSATTGPGGQ
ncbi:MAG: tetratricopeptide repeat protein [Fimbriimonadaceae bacterium]|nr:tetratricopeptide repeat protein [Fimbriimonadaceae bacterium]QYK55680.1 MAG: tetratricopeptide repeat protein [Fimbriimonadaceae bacterium]